MYKNSVIKKGIVESLSRWFWVHPRCTAYFFTCRNPTDGRPVLGVGEPQVFSGSGKGFFVHKTPADALDSLNGGILCKALCKGIRSKDKFTRSNALFCEERTVLSQTDITHLLDKFSKECALEVTHLWKAPKVVLEFLKNYTDYSWGNPRKVTANRFFSNIKRTKVQGQKNIKSRTAESIAREASWGVCCLFPSPSSANGVLSSTAHALSIDNSNRGDDKVFRKNQKRLKKKFNRMVYDVLKQTRKNLE